MTIIFRYITKETLKYFFLILLVIVGIYCAVDFFEKVDNFLEAKLPLTKLLYYLLYKIPFIIAQIMPVCQLIAVLVVFGLMNKFKEVIVLKSSGISFYYLFKPIFLLGIITTIVLFLIAEIIVPITMNKANIIWLQDVRHQQIVTSKKNNIWIKDGNLINYIKYYNPANNNIFGVTFYYFDENFKLINRIDAQKGEFKNNKWILSNIIEQKYDKQNNNYKIMQYKTISKKFAFHPNDFKEVITDNDEMSIAGLYEYIKELEEEGYDATIYKVNFYAKTAFPFACVIMSILGAGIALRKNTATSLPACIAYGIGIAFLYWVFYSFCVSLGYGEVLPPIIAAWIANFVFVCIAIYAIITAE